MSGCVAAPVPDSGASGRPVHLPAGDLDAVTAAGARIVVTVSAFAEGPHARTTTESRATVLRRSILVVEQARGAGEVRRFDAVDVWVADLAYGAGRAFAAGRDRRAACSVTPSLDGVVSLVGTGRQRTVTPASTDCRCGGAAITAAPR